ncbi:MAG: hypothetical protein WEA99_12200 [Brumimicrobium sp.]
MNRKQLIYVFLSIVIVVAALVYFINNPTDNGSPSNKEPAYSSKRWDVDLSLANKDPYGLYIFEELLLAKGKFSEFNEYTDYKLIDSITKLDSSLFMYVGLDFTLTNDEVNKLLNAVARGNQLFLCTEHAPIYLYEQLFSEKPLLFEPRDSAQFIANDSVFPMYYVFENDTLTELWRLFKPDLLTDSTIIHTTAFDYPNYIEVPYGEGSVLIHLNPVVFTNFQLLREKGKDYFKFFVNTLNHPKIQWLTFAEYKPFEIEDNMSETPPDRSLLSELFKYPPFKWAFVIAVFGLLLYFFFRSKRERPVIPAFQNTKNSGFAYVETLAGIYFKGNHAPKILKLMRRNFYDAVYKKFYIDLAKRKSNKPIIALSQKSGISTEEIEKVLKLLETTTSISDNFVSKAYQLQRKFYFNSGIWSEKEKQFLEEQYTVLHRSNNQAIALVISGILLILFGFILLSSTIGWGVLLWPVGIVVLAIGARMMGHAIIKMNKHELIYQPLFGKSTIIKLSDIKSVERNGDLIKIIQANDSSVVVNLQNVGEGYRQKLIELRTLLIKDNYGR